MTRKTVKIKGQRGGGLAATDARSAQRALAPVATGHWVFFLCLRKKKGEGKKIVVLRRYHFYFFIFFIFFAAVTFRPRRAPPTSGAIHKVPYLLPLV